MSDAPNPKRQKKGAEPPPVSYADTIFQKFSACVNKKADAFEDFKSVASHSIVEKKHSKTVTKPQFLALKKMLAERVDEIILAPEREFLEDGKTYTGRMTVRITTTKVAKNEDTGQPQLTLAFDLEAKDLARKESKKKTLSECLKILKNGEPWYPSKQNFLHDITAFEHVRLKSFDLGQDYQIDGDHATALKNYLALAAQTAVLMCRDREEIDKETRDLLPVIVNSIYNQKLRESLQ